MLRVLLPVGISFYTFQAMSYTIDVYRGELRARRSLLDVAVFISFFPHLVAGPIQRASYLLPQVERARRFSLDERASGFYLMLLGLLQEAGRSPTTSGVIANKVFALSDPSFELLWAGVFAFAIQIYADFSAYTDIARGTVALARIRADARTSITRTSRATPADFWRRWNISLSTLVPRLRLHPARRLARRSAWTWVRNVLVTFLLSGLWHGASWNYVLWGSITACC